MKVRIVTDKYTHIYVDDAEIRRVYGYKLEEEVGRKPTLTIEIQPDEIEIETEAEVETIDKKHEDEMREGYKDFLKFLFGNRS